jgi:predicted permease
MLMNAVGLYCIYYFPLEGIKIPFILVVNLMLFVLSVFSFRRIQKMDVQKPNLMVQSVMMGTIIKMMVFAVAALVYAKQQKGPVGLTSLFISMGLYLVYTYLEIQWSLKKQ